jgi:hypothetical protein
MGVGGEMTAKQGGHEHLYRGLLRLYPADYRARFSDQMVQLFADQKRDVGSFRAWLRAPIDVLSTAASEHLRRDRPMAQSLTLAPTPASRLLGLLGVLGGAFLLIAFLGIPISPDLFNLRLPVFNLGAIAVVIAVHIRQAGAGRRLSLAGAIPAIVANTAYMALIVQAVAQAGELGPGDYGPYIGYVASAMWLADMWFGIVTLRLRVMSRLSAWALIIGSFVAFMAQGYFGTVEAGSLMVAGAFGGIALHGLAWIVLGLEVALRRRPAPPTATA